MADDFWDRVHAAQDRGDVYTLADLMASPESPTQRHPVARRARRAAATGRSAPATGPRLHAPPVATEPPPRPMAPPVRFGTLDKWVGAQSELMPIVLGYASIFGQAYKHSGQTEELLPGAFAAALRPSNYINSGQVLALADHDKSKEVASLANGRLYCEEDDLGLFVAAAVSFVPGNDHGLLAALRRDGAVGMSFNTASNVQATSATPEMRRLKSCGVWEVTFATTGSGANPAAAAILGRQPYGHPPLPIGESDDDNPTVLPPGITYRTPLHRKALQRLGEVGATLTMRRPWW